MSKTIVISGPSGSGKSTILTRLFNTHPNQFAFSVSHTTRSPRNGETHGKDYHFVTRPDFEKLRDEEKGFIETAEFSGNLYGTSFATVKEAQDAGKTCVLDVEIEGVKQIKRSGLEAKYLFLKPPNLAILEQRLRGRGTDKEESIKKRLARAEIELVFGDQPGNFDKVVVNEDVDKAYREVEDFCLSA